MGVASKQQRKAAQQDAASGKESVDVCICFKRAVDRIVAEGKLPVYGWGDVVGIDSVNERPEDSRWAGGGSLGGV